MLEFRGRVGSSFFLFNHGTHWQSSTELPSLTELGPGGCRGYVRFTMPRAGPACASDSPTVTAGRAGGGTQLPEPSGSRSRLPRPRRQQPPPTRPRESELDSIDGDDDP